MIYWLALLLIGVIATVILSETPYAENSWIASTTLWPLYLFVLFFGP
jgi:hypothetical protein